jgi:CRP-like cAMP-binding protein
MFKNLSPAEIKQALAISTKAHYKKGDIIFNKDEHGDSFFIVESGRVKIYMRTPANRAKTIAYMEQGDFFGEMALLADEPRTASAKAETDSTLLVVKRQQFMKLLKSNPDFTCGLLLTMCERLRKADQEIESLIFHNMLGRLAGSIVKLCAEIKNPDEQPKIYMNIQELAEYLGTTREPLSRALAMLKRTGMLDYREGCITVLNLAKLKSISPTI